MLMRYRIWRELETFKLLNYNEFPVRNESTTIHSLLWRTPHEHGLITLEWKIIAKNNYVIFISRGFKIDFANFEQRKRIHASRRRCFRNLRGQLVQEFFCLEISFKSFKIANGPILSAFLLHNYCRYAQRLLVRIRDWGAIAASFLHDPYQYACSCTAIAS